jgi:hypothetical protein
MTRQMRRQARALQVLLNDWDPLCVVTSGGPSDEYDCLVWPLMRLLQEGATPEALTEQLAAALHDDFGVDPQLCATAVFAVRAKNWFDTQRDRSGDHGLLLHAGDEAAEQRDAPDGRRPGRDGGAARR